jgi:hypothetical protein
MLELWKRKPIVLWLIGLALTALVIWAWYAYSEYRADRRDWVYVKQLYFGGSRGGGWTRSMKPIHLQVYRVRLSWEPETTYERLDFAIPEAYLAAKSNLSGGSQDAVQLYIHWPSGGPLAFRPRQKAPVGFVKQPDPKQSFNYSYPTDEYFAEVWGASSSVGWVHPKGVNADFREQYLENIIGQGKVIGKHCGYFAIDNPYGPTGGPTFEIDNPYVGLTAEVYVDSLDPKKWNRTIECGPNMGVCKLSSIYQQFALVISFSPLRICDAHHIEDRVKGILDKYLVAHRPPTRLFEQPSEKNQREGFSEWREWTAANLNNTNIREAAQ